MALLPYYLSNIQESQVTKIIFSLELNMELPEGPQGSTVGSMSQVSQEQDELTQRLARLRQTE